MVCLWPLKHWTGNSVGARISKSASHPPVYPPDGFHIGESSLGFFIVWYLAFKSVSSKVQVLVMPVLASCLLTSHWLKQVSWPTRESLWDYMDIVRSWRAPTVTVGPKVSFVYFSWDSCRLDIVICVFSIHFCFKTSPVTIVCWLSGAIQTSVSFPLTSLGQRIHLFFSEDR